MTNREIMLSALQKHTFSMLKEKGFAGKYPKFMRNIGKHIALISFQTNKWGGSFAVEVSVSDGDEANSKRYRLPGMFDGWFYYRDVYRKPTLFFGPVYHDVPEKEAADFIPPKGYKLIQKFDENTAVQICKVINSQFGEAYKWLNGQERLKDKPDRSHRRT